MLIVGDSLAALVSQYGIVDHEHAFDVNSLALRLSREYIEIVVPTGSEVTYGHRIPDEWVETKRIADDGLVLAPRSAVLACSRETISMPDGYIGLLQTKGSLARLFVQVHCCDGQVDSGFRGRITFEICNLAPFTVRLLHGQNIAQLFVFKTSTRHAAPYHGRYQGAEGPTIQLPEP